MDYFHLFYIHDIYNKLDSDGVMYPLYVKNKHGWCINSEIIRKLKDVNTDSWEVGFGYGGNSGGCAKGIFKPTDIALAPRDKMLYAERMLEDNKVMSIEIDINWKSIRYAYIKVH